MSVIDDILSLVRKGRLMTKDLEEFKKYNTQSIAKRAQDFTCQFPCLTADTIPTDKAGVLVKNMDYIYASFLQTVVASDSLIDISVDRGPLDYMKRMHQNLKLESVINEERIFASEREHQEFRTFMESECKDLQIPDNMMESTIEKVHSGDYRLYLDPTGSYGVVFSEAAISLLPQERQDMMTEYLSEFDLNRFPAFEANSLTKSDVLDSFVSSSIKNSTQTTNLKVGDGVSKVPATRLLDREVKRVNDMQPLGIGVRLIAVNDKKEFVQFIDFIVGVKAILHPVKSTEIVDNLAYTLQNKNAFFNFVKWTTGEISLFKDLILHINDAKYNTTYRNRGASPFFPNLRRLKEKKVSVGTFGVRKLVPNSTVIVSSFEVEDLKSRYGFDLRDVALANKVISDLFLMTLVIIDEATDTIEFLYQSSTAFEVYGLETLEREVSLSSNKLGKEIGRMIAK